MASMQGYDFHNKNHIYQTFNSSILAFQKYKKAIASGAKYEAIDSISEASMRLSVVIEWSLKHIVYKHYYKLLQQDPTNIDVSLWQRKITFTKTINYSSRTKYKDMTVHDLVDEVKSIYPTELHSISLRFTKIDNQAIRAELSNGYKHSGIIPKSTSFEETLPEVRLLIQTFIDTEKTAILNSCDDVIDGAWEEFLVSCKYFNSNSNYTYVLLTDRIPLSNDYSSIFNVNWDLILDYDYTTGGLYSAYINKFPKNTPHMITLNNPSMKSGMPISSMPYWVQLNGNSDDPNAIP